MSFPTTSQHFQKYVSENDSPRKKGALNKRDSYFKIAKYAYYILL